ncbi:hypothetical protein ACXDF8_26645 [Mycolicibacterium sp. CBM1]
MVIRSRPAVVAAAATVFFAGLGAAVGTAAAAPSPTPSPAPVTGSSPDEIADMVMAAIEQSPAATTPPVPPPPPG